jgi:hypothetical protein
MATIDMTDHTELVTMSEEGLSAEEVVASSAALGHFTVLMEPDVTVLMKKVLRKGFKGANAQTRNLADAPIDAASASPDCQEDFSGHISKAVSLVAAKGLKVRLSCLIPESESCHTAHDVAASLVQTMTDECVQEPSTDICSQSGDDMDAVDVCNADDLDKLALGDTTITCGGGSLAGAFNPILNSMHLPGRR